MSGLHPCFPCLDATGSDNEACRGGGGGGEKRELSLGFTFKKILYNKAPSANMKLKGSLLEEHGESFVSGLHACSWHRVPSNPPLSHLQNTKTGPAPSPLLRAHQANERATCKRGSGCLVSHPRCWRRSPERIWSMDVLGPPVEEV